MICLRFSLIIHFSSSSSFRSNSNLTHPYPPPFSQYFVSPEWTGGIYASPTIAGSRPGGLLVGAWAAMMAMGVRGYKQCAQEIMKAAKTIAEGYVMTSW